MLSKYQIPSSDPMNLCLARFPKIQLFGVVIKLDHHLFYVIDDNPIVGSSYNFVSTLVISCWTFENLRIGNTICGSPGLNNLRLLTLMDLPYRRLTF